MQPIIYTNGARVYTPKQPASSSVQLGDVNGDGEIDILDAADTTSINLTDLNEDGVIDILDAAEFLARGPGGIEIISVANPEPLIENVFDVAKCCDKNYPDDYWGFGSYYSNRQNSKKCYEFKDPISKISTCLPCNSTPLEEAVCKACATIPPDNALGFGARIVEIYPIGTEPTSPAVKLGKGKSIVTQDGETYVVWCSMIAYRLCVPSRKDGSDELPCWSIEPNDCTCAEPAWNGFSTLKDPPWYALGTDFCAGNTQSACMQYWFFRDYPYPMLQSPETYNGPYTGTFIWSPNPAIDFCVCADTTQDYDPCRYGATLQECIEENGGSIDPGPSIPD